MYPYYKLSAYVVQDLQTRFEDLEICIEILKVL